MVWVHAATSAAELAERMRGVDALLTHSDRWPGTLLHIGRRSGSGAAPCCRLGRSARAVPRAGSHRAFLG
jgi:hypothetical protein